MLGLRHVIVEILHLLPPLLAHRAAGHRWTLVHGDRYINSRRFTIFDWYVSRFAQLLPRFRRSCIHFETDYVTNIGVCCRYIRSLDFVVFRSKKVLNIFDRRSFGNKYLCEECESDGRGLFIINVTVASYVDRQVVPRNILDRCYSI